MRKPKGEVQRKDHSKHGIGIRGGLFAILLTSLSPPALSDPFFPTPQSASESLTHYPISQLKYVGSIDSNAKKWALIQTPDRMIQLASIGALVGEPPQSVVEISPQFIRLACDNADCTHEPALLTINTNAPSSLKSTITPSDISVENK